MMFLLTCDKKLTKSQLSPTHASTKRKITDELKHNAGWYEVREGSPVEVLRPTAEAKSLTAAASYTACLPAAYFESVH